MEVLREGKGSDKSEEGSGAELERKWGKGQGNGLRGGEKWRGKGRGRGWAE